MVTEAAQHVIAAGGKRFRPLLVVLGVPVRSGRRTGRGARRRRRQGRGGGRADPRRQPLPRRRDGRGAAAAGLGQRQRPLGQHGGHPGRRLPVRPGVRGGRRARSGVRPAPGRTFARLVQGQIAETVGPAGRRPAGALPVGGGRQDRLPDRHLRAVRGQGGRRRRWRCSGRWRRSARRSASSSSSATTSSTSPATRPARRRAPICGRASRPCRRCCSGARRTRPHPPTPGCCELLDSDLRDDADLAEALVLLRAHRVRRPGAGRGPASGGPRPLVPDRPARRPRPGRPGRALRHGGHPLALIVTRCSAARLRSEYRSKRRLCAFSDHGGLERLPKRRLCALSDHSGFAICQA